MRKYLFTLLFLSSTVYANTGEVLIERIQVEHGHVYIFSGAMKNPKGCELGGRIKLDKDRPGFQEMYSMALTAFTTSTKIGFWADICGSTPWAKTANIAYASYQVK